MDDPRLLPGGYRLDEADADVEVLHRRDGSFVAAFSAWGATREAVLRATEDDRKHKERLSA